LQIMKQILDLLEVILDLVQQLEDKIVLLFELNLLLDELFLLETRRCASASQSLLDLRSQLPPQKIKLHFHIQPTISLAYIQ
jgi:hypothetical protein